MESKPPFWKLFGSSKSGSSDNNINTKQGRSSVLGGSKGKNQTQNIPQTVYSNRTLLQDYLIKQLEDINLDSVSQLGRLCLNEGTDLNTQNSNSDLIYCGAILLEWSNHRGDEFTPIYYRKLAGAHYEAWMTRGVIGETDHLRYAKSSYELALKHSEINCDPQVWLEYSKILMHLGDAELGLKTISNMIRKFDSDDRQGIYHLTAGAMLSSLGKHEQAGQYFFEAIQIGTPKFFTKSDLMFILSRSFEQLGFETKTSGSDPVEEGYVMVFSHMVSEKYEGTSLTYQEWISSFETWRDIGDKCAMHGLFSLAADLYGQGLVRDKRAFLKSSLWFKFAKSCFRCGRTSDAQLAVKQAVTLDPQNTQCALALKTWSTMSNVVVDLVEGPLQSILELIPISKNKDDLAASRLQAFYRAQSVRFCGIGRVALTPSKRRALMKTLTATTTKVIGEGKKKHSFLFRVRPNWRGDIKRIRFFNLQTDSVGMIVLKSLFRLPLTIYNPSFTYKLSIFCTHIKLLNSSNKNNTYDTDSDDENNNNNNNKNDDNDESDNLSSTYLLSIQFLEVETGFYTMRQLYFILSDDGSFNIVENSIDIKCPRYHNHALIEIPPLLEDSTQPTEINDESNITEQDGKEDENNSYLDDATESLPIREDSTVESSHYLIDGDIETIEERTTVIDDDHDHDKDEDETISYQEDPTIIGDNSIISMDGVESLMSLFIPYRSRRGLFRHFGLMYLYTATFINTSRTSEAIATPSARAIHQNNNHTNTLQIRCLQVNNGTRYLFILPPRLSVMENLNEVFPILLTSVQDISIYEDIKTISKENIIHSDSNYMLTPRRHGISLFNGTMKLLLKATKADDGEIIIHLALPIDTQNITSGLKVGTEEEFVESIRKVLSVYQSKDDAWKNLQDYVSISYDYSNTPRLIEPSNLLQENNDNNDNNDNITNNENDIKENEKNIRGIIQIDNNYFLYNCILSDYLSIRFHKTPEDEVIIFYLPPRHTLINNHLDQLLHILGEHFINFIGKEKVFLKTSKDDTLDDIIYLDALKESLKPIDYNTIVKLMTQDIINNLFQKYNNNNDNKIENIPEEKIKVVEDIKEEEEEEIEIEKEIKVEKENKTENIESNNKSNILLSSQIVSNIVSKAMYNIINPYLQKSEGKFYANDYINRNLNNRNMNIEDSFTTKINTRKQIIELSHSVIDSIINNTVNTSIENAKQKYLQIVSNKTKELSFEYIKEGINTISKKLKQQEDERLAKIIQEKLILQEKEKEREKKEQKLMKHEDVSSLSSNSSNSKGSRFPSLVNFEINNENSDSLPIISLNNLINPNVNIEENENILSYRSIIIDSEKDRPSTIVQSVNVQAAFFLAFQEQRLSCLDYLADRAAKAKHYVLRQHSFEYLKQRVEIAKSKLDPKQHNLNYHGHNQSMGHLITRKHSTPAKKKVAMSEGHEIIDDQRYDNNNNNNTNNNNTNNKNNNETKENKKITRQFSTPHVKDKLPKERRRGTMPAVFTAKPSSPQQVIETIPTTEQSIPNPAKQLHSLLDSQLKDESFTQNPQDLVDALQSLSTDIPSVCLSPRFVALTQQSLTSPSLSSSPQPQQQNEKISKSPTIENDKDNELLLPVSYSPPKERSLLRRASSLLTGLPPQKFGELESKIEIIKSSNSLARVGMGKRNPVDFLDESQQKDSGSTDPLFDESISNFLQRGYSTGTCAYLVRWKNKIINCIKSFPSLGHLEKSIYSLQRAYPEPLTRAGALCALAETNGSVGEALGQLNDKTFKHELVLVCQALPVDEIVNRTSEFNKKYRFQSIENKEKLLEELLLDTEIMRNTRVDINENEDSLYLRDLSPPRGSISDLRHSSELSRSLPHHGMASTSPTVLSRGNLVKRIRENVKDSNKLSSSFDGSSIQLPPINKSILTRSLGSLPPSLNEEEISQNSLFQKSQQHHQVQQELVENRKNTKNKKVQGKNKFINQSNLPSNSTNLAPPPKFTRLERTIDLLTDQSDSIVVMSRLEAYRAQEEELLLKYHPEQSSYFRSSRQKKFLGKLSPVG